MSFDNDQYPKSITKSNNVLSNCRFDVTTKPTISRKNRGDHIKDRDQKDAGKKEEGRRKKKT